jgi:hypothetical protein
VVTSLEPLQVQKACCRSAFFWKQRTLDNPCRCTCILSLQFHGSAVERSFASDHFKKLVLLVGLTLMMAVSTCMYWMSMPLLFMSTKRGVMVMILVRRYQGEGAKLIWTPSSYRMATCRRNAGDGM